MFCGRWKKYFFAGSLKIFYILLQTKDIGAHKKVYTLQWVFLKKKSWELNDTRS